ncbi:MAG: tRNA pseudouridine(55) synthase TruB [Christensenellales bacterium]|jgi:tRNA pseudouridine55 synthase
MNGIVNFLKPPGMSSNGAVMFFRKLLGGVKTGHAGTLDPGACGVLPLCVGKATKISAYLMGGEKEYIAEITFGKTTDTGDSYGRITGMIDADFPDVDDIMQALSQFCGRIFQQTPAYSAAKHEGKKMYELARKGIEIPRKDREVFIRDIKYLTRTKPNAHLIRVVCGKGTYIRTLCEDIGKSLGSLAYMSFLVRTRCAGLNIADAYTANELACSKDDIIKAVLPMDMFLDSIPQADVNKSYRSVLFNGGRVVYHGQDSDAIRVYAENEFIGIGCVKNSQLKITTLLADR